jgi:hypothetical protein
MSGQIDIVCARALIEAHLASIRFERVEDYLRRGRRYAGRSTTSLKIGWREMEARLDNAAGSEDELTRVRDLEAELSLRRERLPPAGHPTGSFSVWRERHLDRLRGDPSQWSAVEWAVYEGALAFVEECRNALKH